MEFRVGTCNETFAQETGQNCATWRKIKTLRFYLVRLFMLVTKLFDKVNI